MDNHELESCTFIKTILMVIIVFYHSILFFGGNWFTIVPLDHIEKPLYYLAAWLNGFHIYAFTFVSGYLFFFLRFEAQKYNRYGAFLLNKAKRLLIPYAFVCACWVVPVFIYFYGDDIPRIISNYVLGSGPNQLWFLLMLFFIFLLFYPLSEFFKKHLFLGAIVVAMLYVLGFLLSYFHLTYFQIYRALTFFPFFWLGFVIKQYDWGVLRRVPALVWFLVYCVLFLASELIPDTRLIFELLSLAVGFLENVAGAIMAFTCLAKLSTHCKWKDSAVFCFLSRLSMPVFLFHQQVIYFVIFYLSARLNHYLCALIAFAVAFSVSVAISIVLMLFRPTRFLIGEKRPLFSKKNKEI